MGQCRRIVTSLPKGSADEVAQASAVSLRGGGFARVVATMEVVAAAG